jgi:thiosulfate/3-mercaptopyruvate sulfurtransferase
MSTILTILAVVAAAPGLLVSPAELAAALKDPTTVVLAIGENPADFELEHIPGARFIRYSEITVDADGLGSELPPVEKLRAVFAGLGVGDRSQVVVYGTPITATRLFFTLDYLGHQSVRVLNGGLAAWKASGGALEGGLSAKAGPVTLTPKPRADAVATADWITERLSSPRITLLDARPDAEFTGADGGMRGAHVVGHLPGAKQLVWNTLLDGNGRFLPDAELEKKLLAIGATKGTPVVSYCMVGMRASVTHFVARHLGYDARMYDGSITDWTRRKLPAQTGR